MGAQEKLLFSHGLIDRFGKFTFESSPDQNHPAVAFISYSLKARGQHRKFFVRMFSHEDKRGSDWSRFAEIWSATGKKAAPQWHCSRVNPRSSTD